MLLAPLDCEHHAAPLDRDGPWWREQQVLPIGLTTGGRRTGRYGLLPWDNKYDPRAGNPKLVAMLSEGHLAALKLLAPGSDQAQSTLEDEGR